MKKLLLVVAFAAVGTIAFAQKPVAGDRTAEVGLNLQTGTAPINYNVPELRFRMFKSDDMAYRLRVNLGSQTTTDKFSFEGAGAFDWEAKTGTGFGIAIAPGIEKHFAGTKRLSPYVGAELGIGFNTGGSIDVTNGSSANIIDAAKDDSYSFNGGSQLSIGLGAVMGADYYVADGVYLGVEFGLGLFNIASVGEGEEKTKVGAGAEVTNKTATSSTTTIFGVAGGGVRLGYKF
jgi:hypothetical protein